MVARNPGLRQEWSWLCDIMVVYASLANEAQVNEAIARRHKPFADLAGHAKDAWRAACLSGGFDLPYQHVNALEYKRPIVIPARTFLSQLP